MNQEPQTSPVPNGPSPADFLSLKSRYLRRTAVANLITLGLVALTTAVYYNPAWAGHYLLAGLWAMFFFGLLPPILRCLIIDRKILAGLGLILIKILLLFLMIAVGYHWKKTSPHPVQVGTALFAGVTTLFAVIVLRALGSISEQAKPSGGPRNHDTKSGVASTSPAE